MIETVLVFKVTFLDTNNNQIIDIFELKQLQLRIVTMVSKIANRKWRLLKLFSILSNLI